MAMSAHDLKNLLTGILLLAERIAMECRPGEVGIEALAHRILGGGKRMQQGINGLMAAAAGELQDYPFQPARCSLSSLLQQVVRSNWEYALSKNIRLRFPDLGSGECWGQVDEECSRLAVDNLVNHAIKFSPRGSEVQVTLLSRTGRGALCLDLGEGPGALAGTGREGQGLRPVSGSVGQTHLG